MSFFCEQRVSADSEIINAYDDRLVLKDSSYRLGSCLEFFFFYKFGRLRQQRFVVTCNYLRTVEFVDIIKLLDCSVKLTIIYLNFIRSAFVLSIVSNPFTQNGHV